MERAQRDNARLLRETRRQLGELSLLHTAAIATARSGSLEAALQEIALSAYDAFEAVNTMVILCAAGFRPLENARAGGRSAEAADHA